jgi:hypothetical protein
MKLILSLYILLFSLSSFATPKRFWSEWNVPGNRDDISAEYEMLGLEGDLLSLKIHYSFADCEDTLPEVVFRTQIEELMLGGSSEMPETGNDFNSILYLTVEVKSLSTHELCQKAGDGAAIINVKLPKSALDNVGGKIDFIRISGGKLINSIWIRATK